jgi:hypothetical protein
MRYKVKSVGALQTILSSLPDRTQVEVDPDIDMHAKTVGDLRKLTSWPANLAIATPPEWRSDSVVKITKTNVSTRVSPKP